MQYQKPQQVPPALVTLKLAAGVANSCPTAYCTTPPLHNNSEYMHSVCVAPYFHAVSLTSVTGGVGFVSSETIECD